MSRKRIPEYEVGDIIKNKKVDARIIGKEVRSIREKYNYKGQQYKNTDRLFYHCLCNKCNHDYWKRKADIDTTGCTICTSFKIIQGHNDIATKYPDLVQYFVNPDDAYTHTPMSSKRLLLKCPICGQTKQMPISDFVTHGLACHGCSDGISYPEKFVASLLKQTETIFITQLSRVTFEWCDKYRYDFYIPRINTIIEVNGAQHYHETTGGWVKSQNDELKKQLAINNGVTYIEIDASLSNMTFIKESILQSELKKILPLEKVNWEKCHADALSSNVKIACNYWNNGLTTGEIAQKMDVSIVSVKHYLQKGALAQMCDYTTLKGTDRALAVRKDKYGRKVEVYKENTLIGKFNSIKDLVEQSMLLYGIKFSRSQVSEAIRGIRNNYAKYGYEFKSPSCNNT